MASVALTGCATTEMKMTPAASAGVGVRFSRGEALMVSAGELGAIAIKPIRYNADTGRVLFVVAGYNHSGEPINFGTENVSISLDNGASMPVYDFDALRHGYREDADRARMFAYVEAAANAYGAYRVSRHNPQEGRYLMERASEQYEERLYSIGDNLGRQVEAAKAVLQTTTIDPGTYWAGWIVADQPTLAVGEVRKMNVSVTFAGETHRFSLFLAPEGTPTPPQVSLPAVTRVSGEALLHHTAPTWLWDKPPPPSPLTPELHIVE
jgi:hypothetical protein